MSDGTHIEWTDATVNAINGCSVVSPGCTHCYAMRLAGTRLRGHPTRAGLTTDSKAGPVWNGEVRLNEAALLQPLRWRRSRRIFWNAHGDMFHPAVPDEWIDRCFAVMALTPHHIHQVLTKRSDRMLAYFTAPLNSLFHTRLSMMQDAAYRIMATIDGHWDEARGMKARDAVTAALKWTDSRTNVGFANVWLGVSVEDQKRADERIPDLLATPSAVRWLSCEPLLGPIDLTSIKAPREPDEPDQDTDWRFDSLTVGDFYWFGGDDGQPGDCGDGPYRENRIDWVVVGGESGPGARPMHNTWAQSIRDHCAKATLYGDDAPVPFFFKQWGDWAPVCAMGEVENDTLYHKPRHYEGSRRCKVEQLVMQASGRIFPVDEWSRSFGEDPATGDFAYLAGAGAMKYMRIGKRSAGRLIDGVQHDGMPA